MVKGTVRHQAFLGNMVNCAVEAGDLTVLVQLHPAAAGKVGDDVWLHLPPESCVVVSD